MTSGDRRQPRARALLVAACCLAVAGCNAPSRFGVAPVPAGVVRGKARLQVNDVAGATGEFDRAIKADPKNAAIYEQIAQAAADAHHADLAQSYLEKGGAVTQISKDSRSVMWLQASMIASMAGRKDPAIADAEAAYALTPNDARTENALGYMYALFLDTDNPGDRPKLERALELTTQAVGHARDAWSSSPTDLAMYLDSLGWVQYKLHDYATALANLERAADELPQEVEVQYHLGMAYAKLKRYSDAAIAFKRALKIKPDYGPANSALYDLAPFLPPIQPDKSAPAVPVGTSTQVQSAPSGPGTP